MFQRRNFTLLELVVAIAVIALTVSLAVTSFRGESPVQKLNNAGLHFEAFCAKVRFQAVENGADRTVLFDPETKTFKIGIPEEFQPEEGSEEQERLRKLAVIEWKLPDEFELDSAISDQADHAEEAIEVFRFFPDGGAAGILQFELRHKTLRKVFGISPLTGLLTQTETAETP